MHTPISTFILKYNLQLQQSYTQTSIQVHSPTPTITLTLKYTESLQCSHLSAHILLHSPTPR